MALSYRALVAADTDFILHVHHLVMRAHVEGLWGWDQAVQDRLAVEFLSYPGATNEMILHCERAIGYSSYQDQPDALYLYKLYLHPDYQGRGHGAAVLSRLVNRVRAETKPIELSVVVNNLRAFRFYERHGFVLVAATPTKFTMRWSPKQA